MDIRGHGKSEGIKGFFENGEGNERLLNLKIFLVMLDDLLNFVNITKKEYKEDIPMFLCGYSLGGYLSVELSIKMENYFNGVVLIAPALAHDSAKKPFNMFALNIFKFFNRFFPTLKLFWFRGN